MNDCVRERPEGPVTEGQPGPTPTCGGEESLAALLRQQNRALTELICAVNGLTAVVLAALRRDG